jgi:hypothetical protein
MPLLEGTLVAALLLIPGFFSLALALSPRSRAIRQSSLGTRIFGLLIFAVANWGLALLAYSNLPFGGTHCQDLASLLVGSDGEKRVEILAAMLRLPAPLAWGVVLMFAVSLFTGGVCAILHHAALTGVAIRNYDIKMDGLPRRTWIWSRFSQGVDSILHFFRLSDVFQPLGAGYWLVLLKAAQLLQRSSEVQKKSRRRARKAAAGGQPLAEGTTRGKKVARVYVDVVQGDEDGGGGKVGVLYSGTVKHLVCETDGNVVFVLLTEAKRWSRRKSPDPAVNSSPEQSCVLGVSTKAVPAVAPEKSIAPRVRPIENSLALGLDGRNIRNISFRLIETNAIEIPESSWPM